MTILTDNRWQPADFWSRDREGGLWCHLCPFHCHFTDDTVGRCRVRRRRGDHLETATFALPLRHRQPIERKPFYHVHPGAMTLTLASPGCNFRCDYCQNASFAHAEPEEAMAPDTPALDPAALVAETGRDGLILALSFTEPTLAAEATLALHDHAAGRIPIVWKSNGFITPKAVSRLAPALTAVNIDLKAADPDTHLRLAAAPLGPVIKGMHAFATAGVWVEVSTTVIPGVNDHPTALAAMAAMVADLGADTPWHLRRFHPDHQRQDTDPTSPATLSQAVRIAHDAGLRHVYVERALGPDGRTTRCHACGEIVITRHVAGFLASELDKGGCPGCGTALAGRW